MKHSPVCEASTAPVSDVQRFWETEACGSHFVQGARGTREFFDQYRRFRYQTEWHIPVLVPFKETRGKTVLEIGCGNGADGVMFALEGADYTGVDLTQTAVDATRLHFCTLGLRGSFAVENAEQLSFPDASFDFVYSHGVLHHSPNPLRAFDEVHRVLKPGGRAVLMLYHKHSFNYYVRILGYMRVRLLLRILSRVGHWSDDRANVSEEITGIRGNVQESVWQIHYANFLRWGYPYLQAKTFVHHATDGPECPIAFVYTRSQAKQIFGRFRSVNTKLAHFPLHKYSKNIPLGVEKTLASLAGWYLFVYLEK